MKAKELQLNDWVQTNYGSVGQVHQIEDGFVDLIEEKYFEPIPLTPEILENNGFVQQEGDIIALHRDTHYLYAEYLKNIKKIRICADKYLCGFNVNIDVSYVHQLQHALRLCGLNDLADNFKIN